MLHVTSYKEAKEAIEISLGIARDYHKAGKKAAGNHFIQEARECVEAEGWTTGEREALEALLPVAEVSEADKSFAEAKEELFRLVGVWEKANNDGAWKVADNAVRDAGDLIYQGDWPEWQYRELDSIYCTDMC